MATAYLLTIDQTACFVAKKTTSHPKAQTNRHINTNSAKCEPIGHINANFGHLSINPLE